MIPAVKYIADATGINYDRVYEILKVIRQFERYAEDENNDSATYDAGFAGGLREALKMQSSINNYNIDLAIKVMFGSSQ